MTKGFACEACMCLRTLSQGNFTPVFCDCGVSGGWWVDGPRGDARYVTKSRFGQTLGVGFNNRFLTRIFEKTRHNDSAESWRDLHEGQGNAPGYLFDKSNRNCWVVTFRPGTVANVAWASFEEQQQVSVEQDYFDLMVDAGLVSIKGVT